MADTSIFEDDKPRSVDVRVWRGILRHALPYRAHGLGLAGMALLVALCEVLLPFFAGRIIDAVTGSRAGPGIWTYGVAYGVTAGFLCGAILGFILLAGRIATGVSHDIRRASFARLQQLPFAYYDQRPIGWLMARLTSDCDRLSRIIGWTLLDFLWGFAMLFGISTVMLALEWRLALIVLTVVPPLALVSVFFQRRLLHSARAVRRANAEITASFNENIMGVRTSKALVRERDNLEEFGHGSERMYEHSVRNALQSAVYVPMVISLGSIMAGLALWFGGAGVLGGTMTLGMLVTFMSYAGLFFDPVQEMARQLTEVQMAQAAAERIQGLLETEPAIKDSPGVLAAIAETARDGPRPGMALDGSPDRIDRIEFSNVTFAYRADRPVLESFDLTVGAGDTIALVGSTGGGKSTIVSLLCRFYEPIEGKILVDGVDYRDRSLDWYQSKLGIVLQTPHLFSGTIRDNIRYGDLDADDERIVRAAKLVNAHDDILQMPDGYDAEVGEGGSRLSTGQRQLISLARAVLADPRIFVLDEATSSVDTETEHRIQKGIEVALRGRINFVIAHRLSTIRSATRILVIEKGRVAESGRHDELLRLHGRYHELLLHQFGVDQLGDLAPSPS